MTNIREIIKNLSVGDIVNITITDCGTGNAVIMDISNDTITIKVDVNTFACCYNHQKLVNSIFSIKVEDVCEINKIKEDNKMKTNFNSLKVGDTINITIKNCGSGIATIMYVKNSFRENYITIRMYRNTFIPCCNGQSIDNPFMVVDIDDIEQLEIIEDVYKELNDELIKRKLIYGPSYEENDCSEAVLSDVYDWGFAIYRRDETGQFYLFYDNNYELITSVCVESEYYEITGNFEATENTLTIKTSDGKVIKINVSKEEAKMMNTATTATRTLNMGKVERLMYVRDNLIYVTKTTDERYIKKEELAQFLFDNNIISRMPGKNELRKTKRQELVDILMAAVQNLIDIKAITPINAAPISVDDLEDIMLGNTPAQDVQPGKRREKYNLFCYLVKANAIDNQKKGYGHVVSAYMLCAHILKVEYGIEKLKGHEKEITSDQREKVKEIRNFMIHKGHLKAVTWSANNVTYYSSEYDGKNKNFMVPVEKAPKDAKLAVTTYKVMW